MKKSEIYRIAQRAVLLCDIDNEVKLEILRELIGREESAWYLENAQAKEDENNV